MKQTESKAKDVELHVSSIYEVFSFVLQTIKDNFSDGTDNVAYSYLSHLISPFFAGKNDFKIIKELKARGKVHYVSSSDSPLDQILTKFYNEFGSQVKLGAEMDIDTDLFLVNDVVIRIHMPTEVKEKLDELYFDTKSILSFNMIKFFKRFAEDDVDIKIEVIRDSEKAKMLLEKFEKWF